ncbi:MAG: hypothetical protein WCO62_00380 [Betaproteobacteria bacterium]
MLVYNVSFTSTTVPAAGTFIASLFTNTATTGTGRSVMILEVDIEGGNNTSMYSEVGFYRAAAPTGTTTALPSSTTASVAVDISAPTAACVWTVGAFSAGVTGPTGISALPLSSTPPVHRIGINGNGQRYFWRANPNLNNAIVVPGTGVLSSTVFTGALILASITAGTTNPISGRIQFAEM